MSVTRPRGPATPASRTRVLAPCTCDRQGANSRKGQRLSPSLHKHDRSLTELSSSTKEDRARSANTDTGGQSGGDEDGSGAVDEAEVSAVVVGAAVDAVAGGGGRGDAIA